MTVIESLPDNKNLKLETSSPQTRAKQTKNERIMLFIYTIFHSRWSKLPVISAISLLCAEGRLPHRITAANENKSGPQFPISPRSLSLLAH